MQTEQLIEEAVAEFDKRFASVKETDAHYYNPYIHDMKAFLRIKLSTIASKSAEEAAQRVFQQSVESRKLFSYREGSQEYRKGYDRGIKQAIGRASDGILTQEHFKALSQPKEFEVDLKIDSVEQFKNSHPPQEEHNAK